MTDDRDDVVVSRQRVGRDLKFFKKIRNHWQSSYAQDDRCRADDGDVAGQWCRSRMSRVSVDDGAFVHVLSRAALLQWRNERPTFDAITFEVIFLRRGGLLGCLKASFRKRLPSWQRSKPSRMR
ncbi:MAG: hypothetical protein KIT36_09610 [Alphaproteobacteria bacterium]|nr:hypothetical protein [Alphaproteobacteria bacterium]